MNLQDLVNKTVTGYEINSSKDMLTLKTTEGDFALDATGDCCSTSWFETVDMPSLPFKIVGVAEVPMGEVVERTEYNMIEKYSLKLITDKGHVDLEYRNESNGYYGGYVELRKV